jgi:hypothetical protein
MVTSRLKLGELSESLKQTILSQATVRTVQRDMVSNPYSFPNKRFNDKPCRLCDKVFSPIAPSNHFCTDECKMIWTLNKGLVNTYGITVLDWLDLYNRQQGGCAICKSGGFVMNKDRHVRKLVVDHCHTTGVVRGLLCHQCNQGIGLFKENLEFLKRAVAHVEGATTISKESTPKRVEAPSSSEEDDDIV